MLLAKKIGHEDGVLLIHKMFPKTLKALARMKFESDQPLEFSVCGSPGFVDLICT